MEAKRDEALTFVSVAWWIQQTDEQMDKNKRWLKWWNGHMRRWSACIQWIMSRNENGINYESTGTFNVKQKHATNQHRGLKTK